MEQEKVDLAGEWARAVLDQAAALLAERLQCGQVEAFTQLIRLAQDADLPVTEAAALLLGSPLPISRVADTTGFDTPAYLRLSRPAPGKNPPEPDVAQPEPPVLRALLDVVPMPVTLLVPVGDEAGRPADFVICNRNAEANRAVPGHDDIVGRLLSEVFPGTVPSGLVESLLQVLQTGRPLRLDHFRSVEVIDGEARPVTVDVHAHRLGRGVLACWRIHHDIADRLRHLDQVERLGQVGWGEWNLYANEILWSEQLYRMHDRDPSAGPLTLEQYPPLVHPDDVPIVAGLLRALTETGEKTEVEYRIQPGDEVRHLRVIAEPVHDLQGRLLTISGVFQDVTARRTAEQALAASRAQVETERRRATLELQQAILPSTREELTLPLYEVAVRCVPSTAYDRIGGDWYDVRALLDGRGLIAIGDIAGHGLSAAATMGRIGNALRGLATTGESPDRLLDWLNQLICQTEPDTTATALIGHLSPDTPHLTWAQAGHPPPILVRNGNATTLTPPDGCLLGATPQPTFHYARQTLMPDDLVILYTDGLVERRGHDIDASITALGDLAAGLTDPDASGIADALLAKFPPESTDDDICLITIRVTA